jgi:23S rRNA pseudouridine2604 synthase
VAYRCEQAQLDLLALRRIRLGRVALSDLPEGQWRYLAVGEKF